MNSRPALITALLLGSATLLLVTGQSAQMAEAAEATGGTARAAHTHPPGAGHRELDLAQATRHATQVFDRVDSNQDQQITPAELAAARPMAFGHGGPGRRHHRMNGHHDMPMGQGHEFAPPMPGGPAGMRPPFEAALPPPDDADNNAHAAGAWPSRDELQRAVFARLDANRDGSVTAAEFSNIAKARRDEMLERGFKRMDRDSDGVLSRTEFPPMRTRLQALDTNHDGKVSRDEFPARGPHRAVPRS